MQDDDDDGGGFAAACVNWNPEKEECYCMGELSDIRNYGYGDDYSCEDFDSSGFLLASPGVSCSAACAAVGAECEANYSHSVDEMSCVFQYLGVTCRGMDGFTGGDYTPAVLIGTPWWGDDDDYVSSLDDAHCWYHNQGSNCDAAGTGYWDYISRLCYCPANSSYSNSYNYSDSDSYRNSFRHEIDASDYCVRLDDNNWGVAVPRGTAFPGDCDSDGYEHECPSGLEPIVPRNREHWARWGLRTVHCTA